MTYAQNGQIQASDYNDFRTTVLNVYGVGNGDSGYGQSTIPLPPVQGGGVERVKSIEWTRLNNLLQVLSNHQGTTPNLPNNSLLAVDQRIRAHPPASGDFPSTIAAASSNRLLAANLSMTIFPSVYVATRVTAWDTSVETEFVATWANADAARYFFNTGGEIRITPARTGGATNAQNTSWTTFLDNIGVIRFRAHTTTNSGSQRGSKNLGYYEITSEIGEKTAIFYGVNGAYGYGYGDSNEFIVEVSSNGEQGANGDNGYILTFTVTFNDNEYTPADPISGTLTVSVDEWKATTYMTGILGAAYTQTEPL